VAEHKVTTSQNEVEYQATWFQFFCTT
jgi:hypothetical protein